MTFDAIFQTLHDTLTAHDLDASVSLTPAHDAFREFLALIESGQVRAAAPDGNGVYQCDARVKQAILFGFKLGHLVENEDSTFQFCDKHNLMPHLQNLIERKIRIVPGGTTVRRGAYLGSSVTIMPPAYVNIGAWVDHDTMIDSHALVGSCAQIGAHCHISAGTQIGGVLEPIGALPVVVEDHAFVGGNCGIYEGTHLHPNVVIAAGTILTRATPVFDLVQEKILRAQEGVLHIPEGAVVVPGARAIQSPFGRKLGLSAYTPLIIKYRDDKTQSSIELEPWLR